MREEQQWYIYLLQKKSWKHFQLLMCKNISHIIENIIIHILLQYKQIQKVSTKRASYCA